MGVEAVDVEVAVVGGGIAGMSAAGVLARDGVSVAVLEQEPQLAYHASGRSAAAFLESYGSAEVRALTRASRPIFDAAAEGEAAPLLSPRALVWLAGEGQVGELEHLLASEPLVRPLTEARARELFPHLRPGWMKAGAIEEDAQDLDVAGLFECYRRLAVHNGVTVWTRAPVRQAQRQGTGWVVHTDAGVVRCATLVNAAGAWADDLAARCGVGPLGLRPLRRTVAIVSCDTVDRSWPLIGDIGETFYFRPEGDALLVSPADETPTEPCDARPTTEDIALAIERANEATTLGLRHVRTAWAGLRTFAPDRNLVAGFDPTCAGFFWLAGQGGYGMQTAPALAVLASTLVRDAPLPAALADEGLDPARLSPSRLR